MPYRPISEPTAPEAVKTLTLAAACSSGGRLTQGEARVLIRLIEAGARARARERARDERLAGVA